MSFEEIAYREDNWNWFFPQKYDRFWDPIDEDIGWISDIEMLMPKFGLDTDRIISILREDEYNWDRFDEHNNQIFDSIWEGCM